MDNSSTCSISQSYYVSNCFSKSVVLSHRTPTLCRASEVYFVHSTDFFLHYKQPWCCLSRGLPSSSQTQHATEHFSAGSFRRLTPRKEKTYLFDDSTYRPTDIHLSSWSDGRDLCVDVLMVSHSSLLDIIKSVEQQRKQLSSEMTKYERLWRAKPFVHVVYFGDYRWFRHQDKATSLSVNNCPDWCKALKSLHCSAAHSSTCFFYHPACNNRRVPYEGRVSQVTPPYVTISINYMKPRSPTTWNNPQAKQLQQKKSKKLQKEQQTSPNHIQLITKRLNNYTL